jgi:hypothetical protein
VWIGAEACDPCPWGVDGADSRESVQA